MTTIAYKDGIMAADTMGTWGGDVNYGVPKLAKTRSYLLGFAGSYAAANPLYNWIKRLDNQDIRLENFHNYREELPEGIPDITVLIAPVDGSTLWYIVSDGYGGPLWTKKFDAIGSGGRFACGAMHAGANAMRAVRAAIDLDEGTGGDIVTLDFEDEPCDLFGLDMTPVESY